MLVRTDSSSGRGYALEQREPLVAHGVQIPFERPEDALILTQNIRRVIADGRFEQREARFLGQIVNPEDTVLEVGAGIGVISALVARRLEGGRVFAVEANPHLLSFMARVHALNGCSAVERVNAILCNGGDDSRQIYLREDFWMSSTAPGPEPYVEVVNVPVFGFDRFLCDEGVNLLICDIEGAEVELLCTSDLPNVDRILLEMHDHLTGLGGIRDLFAHLAAHGFAYDPRYSDGPVVLFRRVPPDETLRPYAG